MLNRNHAKHETRNTAIKQISMASAARRQIIIGGSAHTSRRPDQRCALGLSSSFVTQSQLYKQNEYILLDFFKNITFKISTLKNGRSRVYLDFNSYYSVYMHNQFVFQKSLSFRGRSPQNPRGALPLAPAGRGFQ